MLFKKVNIPKHHMLNLMISCICLHNMCIINLDDFYMDWALKVQKNTIRRKFNICQHQMN